MKIKIIAACMMVISFMPVYAQEELTPSDNAANSSQKETISPSSEPSGSIHDPRDANDKKEIGGDANIGAKSSGEKGNRNSAHSSFLSNQDNGTIQNHSIVRENDNSFKGIESEGDQGKIATTDVSNFYDAQHTNEGQQNIWGFIALLVAIVSLCVAGYNYITLQPKKSNKKGRYSRQQEQSNTERDILNKMNIVNRDLQSRITQLSNQIEVLETQFNRLSMGQTFNSTTQSRPENPCRTSSLNEIDQNQTNSNTGGTKLYATQVLSDCFPSDGVLEGNSDYVIAILSVKGDNGTFVINDKPSAQSFLISNFAYGAGRVADVNQQGDNPTRIETIQPGSIRRQANGWKITTNAKVRII